MRDLLILVPDKNTEYVVRGGLSRLESLGIRAIEFQVVVDPGRDGGVRSRGIQILGMQKRDFTHALMMFDYDGCGSETPAPALEAELDKELSGNWGAEGKVIVIQPEVDVWMWGADVHLSELLNWSLPRSIRDWLVSCGFELDATASRNGPKRRSKPCSGR